MIEDDSILLELKQRRYADIFRIGVQMEGLQPRLHQQSK